MDGSTEIPLCDNEPIHIPGSIQPHGLMLVASRDTLMLLQAAGSVEDWLGVHQWHGAPLASLIGANLAAAVAEFADTAPEHGAPHCAYIGQLTGAGGHRLDVSAHVSGLAGAPPDERFLLVIELEPAPADPIPAAMLLDRLEDATSTFRRAPTLEALCAAAARAFRRLIGFDRVMIYRFGEDDGAGRVLAEDRRPDQRSFLNHHFPGSDIPRQARALYQRNQVRVIPDIHYTPAALHPPAPGSPLDMTDSSLRSVSPIHLQYLFNMGVRASASFSIVKDNALWGLVACHNETPLRIPYDIRVGCRTLAAALSREITGKEEADGYRQRLRLRSFEDDVIRLLSREATLTEALSRHTADVQRALGGDGVAVLRGDELITGGACPSEPEIRALAAWIAKPGADPVSATDRLSMLYQPAEAFSDVGSGLLALVVSITEPWLVLWFRAEQIEKVNWAGNPHKGVNLPPDEQLTPRASFDDWVETVRGRARPWTQPELECATRLRAALLEVRQNRRMIELNRQLTDLLHDKDQLLQQKEFLMGEVNHRVQNSLQLVSSFLSMQARSAENPAVRESLDEAQRRLNAVGLVHRRLYRGERVEMIDAARYVEELCADTLTAMGPEWRPHLSLDLAPITISTDRAVPIGLVLTELMINVNKYAYAGAPGPLEITLAQHRRDLQLTVSDRGIGRQSAKSGFGSRLMTALVQQLGGELAYEDNRPGLRAILTAASG
jgi:light-regulated signal transduction histidine kinase (bacteriophytochrome)